MNFSKCGGWRVAEGKVVGEMIKERPNEYNEIYI